MCRQVGALACLSETDIFFSVFSQVCGWQNLCQRPYQPPHKDQKASRADVDIGSRTKTSSPGLNCCITAFLSNHCFTSLREEETASFANEEARRLSAPLEGHSYMTKNKLRWTEPKKCLFHITDGKENKMNPFILALTIS